jgi:hypothetical protein
MKGNNDEWCFSGNPKKFNMLVQLVQVDTKSKWGYATSGQYDRSKSIHGSETKFLSI